MKKFMSLMLVLVLALSMSTVAFAAEETTYKDMSTVTISKTYKATNTGTTSPAETFTFDIVRKSVTDSADGVTADNMPLPTIGTVAYTAGEAGSATMTKDITITLPTYKNVGIYTYTITEKTGTTAGVTYYKDEITLVVTVIQDATGKVRVAAVHTEEPIDESNANGTKSDDFANEYSAGSLAVSKNVTGNMGDQTKDFTVKVTFTAPADKTVKEAISYTDGDEAKTIAAGWTTTVEVTIDLKHGETVTFTNIPYGVTYAVAESDYTSEGYDAAKYSLNSAEDTTTSVSNEALDSASESVVITNNKGVEVDTGITTDSMPYVLMLALVCAAAILYAVNKRRYMED